MARRRAGDARRVSEAAPDSAAARTSLWRAADEPRREDALLLDTHAWVWTLDDSLERLAPDAAALISRAAADGRLYVSDISYWEVSLKASKGKLGLSTNPTVWLARAAEAPGIRGLPLSREVLIQSTLLKGMPHGDPADRILIAQAQLGSMSLLTCDRLIIDYAARQPGVPVCDAGPR